MEEIVYCSSRIYTEYPDEVRRMTKGKKLKIIKDLEDVTYDECLDITGHDKGDIIQEKTGKHPSRVFHETLNKEGYNEGQQLQILETYGLLPEEKIKRITTNSKYKKHRSNGIYYTYEMIYTEPVKYKRVLKKLGFNVDNVPYWQKVEQIMKQEGGQLI